MTGTDFFGVLEVLIRREVQFVLIGGLAARLHGSPTVTIDVDICCARDTHNLDRLAGALRAMDAQLRSVNEVVPFTLDVKTLERSTNLTLMTSRGALDVLGEPAGTGGYRELAANAITLEVEGLPLKVASLDDLMRMKEASGRPKDRIELEVLGALRDELEG
ncbi:MAG: hypothetical protein M3516_03765 [Actinomycetota bacterium]|nr:hypothetical protein [Actinomycetota bacterium]